MSFGTILGTTYSCCRPPVPCGFHLQTLTRLANRAVRIMHETGSADVLDFEIDDFSDATGWPRGDVVELVHKVTGGIR